MGDRWKRRHSIETVCLFYIVDQVCLYKKKKESLVSDIEEDGESIQSPTLHFSEVLANKMKKIKKGGRGRKTNRKSLNNKQKKFAVRTDLEESSNVLKEEKEVTARDNKEDKTAPQHEQEVGKEEKKTETEAEEQKKTAK
ncbi:hypothetical protein RFI_14344 [Reticulomyxa filosa]|uniref:Uncharacterized protein n=1 Tax=Reticulomyxa filosa TaxID=46433 RepID=X6NAC2_RETFI|nr:hypothetical protein RFI_14344 [Reticulomyxa filosa]|eukprot:ETO22848.1 hypothetical protein RFI_14344 [Reticulomyxa filosa]